MDEKKTAEAPESRFGLWLFLYAFLLLTVGGMLLFALNEYLQAYEDSQVKYTLSDYRDSLEQRLPEAAIRALDGLDPAVQSPEENRAWALELLQGVYLVKDAVDSTEERPVYWIKLSDGGWVGTVTFGVTRRGRFGVPVWGPVEERFDFSPFYQTLDVLVPPGYAVFLGGRRLENDCIVETGVHYDALEECYPHYDGMPTMLRYRSVPFVGSPELRVFDETGRELKPEELEQERLLYRCAPEDRAAVEEFIPVLLHDYIYYTADLGGSALGWYFILRQHVAPGSQLSTRIDQALESFGYTNTRNVEILSVEVCDVADLGGGRFLADVHYRTLVTAQQGPVEMEDRARVLLRRYEGKLLAEALYPY